MVINKGLWFHRPFFIRKMDIQELDSNLNVDGSGLEVNSQVTSYIENTAKWAKFLAIVGFVFTGLMVLGALFMFSVGSSTRYVGGAMMGGSFMYILMAVLYFFPCLYLYNSSTNLLEAVNNNDQISFEEGFKNLNSCFRFVGVLTIVVLSIYALAILIFLMGSMSSGF